MKKTLLWLTALGALVGTTSGCEVTVVDDPRGFDFALDGAWLVNGLPADATTCADAGISTVQLVVFEGGVEYVYSDLRFPCSQGSFDTVNEFLDYGSYTTQWRALDSSGAVIGTSGMLALVVDFPTERASLATADFIVETVPTFNPLGDDASLSADWLINGDVANVDTCAAAGVATVEIIFYPTEARTAGTGVLMAMAPCGEGKFDSRPMNLVAAGEYFTRISALDAAGVPLADFDFPGALVVGATTHVMLAPADFPLAPPVPTLDLTFGWDTNVDPTIMADADCATAGVEVMSYMLSPMGGGTNIAEEFDVACADGLIFEDLAPGEYQIYVEGGTAAVKSWMVTCDMLLVESGVEAYDCFVDKVL